MATLRMLSSFLFCASVAVCLARNRCNYNEQHILTERACGKKVVEEVVEKVNSVFTVGDNEFLKRIAWRESKFGRDWNTFTKPNYYGGIWQVDDTGFYDTQNDGAHGDLPRKWNLTREKFPNLTYWPDVQWMDLLKPLYSGLAARLKLSNVDDHIPPASDIEGQANYWKDYYNTKKGKGKPKEFVEDTLNLIGRERSCNKRKRKSVESNEL